MKKTKQTLPFIATITMVSLFTAISGFAHRQWILPSTTILSGEDQWISVDAAISNDLFFANHHAIPLGGIRALSPGGKSLELRNAAEGHIRTAFELLLEEQGSYRIFSEGAMMFASWKQDGEMQRTRASVEEMGKKNLTSMDELKLAKYTSRVESIVTCGEPTELSLSGKGLEFEFVTHPNDLFNGEEATFKVMLNGKPIAGQEVTVVKGNDRFRDSVDELLVTSDKDGFIKISWPEPGRYWINASADLADGEFKGFPLKQGSSYTLTVEVLPE